MPADHPPLHILARDVGRHAVGPSRLGLPIVVRIIYAGRALVQAECVHGAFVGRAVTLPKRWRGAAWCDEPTDVMDLEAAEPRPPGGRVGVVREGRWIVLQGAAADAVWQAAGGSHG